MTIVGTTTYVVETIYTVKNNASGELGDIDKHARAAAHSTETLSSVLKGIGLAVIGSTGINVAKHAFIDFNARVQDSQSQIAGMLALASKTSFTDNIARADKLYANLQKRAASLPGTTQEYVEMAGSLTQPLINAGLGMKNLEDMTVNTVVAAKALRVEAGAAARDVDQALRGQYHSVDQFTGKLLGSMGYAGEAGRAKFNALDSAKRASELQKAIMQPQIAEMAAAQGQSFTGVLSTLEDNFEQTLGKTGRPLFKAITDEIVRWNEWLDKNSVKIDHIVEKVGHGLVEGFEMAKSAVAWIVDHADTLIAIGEVWAGTKLAGKLGAGLSGSLGGLMGGIGNAAGASWTSASAGGILQVGTAAYLATTAFMQLTGASDALLMAIDPHRAELEKLTRSMHEWDDALEQSKRDLQGKGQTGAQASNTYAGMMAAAQMVSQELNQLQDADRLIKAGKAGGGDSSAIIRGSDKLRGLYDAREASKLMSDDYRAARIAKLMDERNATREYAGLASNQTNASVEAVMKTLSDSQRASIDEKKAVQQVMEEMNRSFRTTGFGLSMERVRAILLGEQNAAGKDPFSQARPNVTNIKIDKVEVAAKDPDRWIQDLDAAAKRRLNGPRGSRAPVSGR